MPQLIIQFTEEGQGWRGSNVRSIWGGLKAYRQKIEGRVGTNGSDTKALNVLKNTSSTQDEIAAALRNSSPEFQKQAALVNNNVTALEKYNKKVEASAHPLQALGSNLKNIGLSLLSNFVQMGAVWLVSKAIEGVVNLVDSYVNAMKYAKEAAEDLTASWEKVNTAQKEGKNTIEQYADRYIALKKGVDTSSGKNLSLTDAEYEEYQKAVAAIGEMFPDLVSGWNDSNEAIRLNVNSVEDLNKALDETIQKQRDLVLANSGDFQDKAAKVDLAGTSGSVTRAKEILEVMGDKEEMNKILLSYASGKISDSRIEKIFSTAGIMKQSTGSAQYRIISTDWQEHLEDFRNQLAAFISTESTSLNTITEGWRSLANAYVSTQFSGADSSYKIDGFNASSIPADLQTGILSYLNSQGADFYAQFKSLADLTTRLGGIITEVGDVAADAKDATQTYQEAAEKWANGEIGYKKYTDARQSFVDSWKGLQSADSELYDSFIPYLRDLYGGDFAPYEALRTRAQNLGVPEERLGELTSTHLSYIGTLEDTGKKAFEGWEDFLTKFGKYQTQLETAYDTLSSRWKNIQTAQTTATEVMTATDSNGGVLTRENYDKLVSANKAYAGVVTTFGGVTSIDNDRLNQIMDDQAKELAVKARSGLDQAMEDFRTQQAELMKLRRTGTEDEIAAKEQEIEATKDTIMHFELLQQELEYSTSAYAKWKRAQSGSESGDTFREIKSAITDLKEGRKSGRTNTNKFKTAGDLIFGDTTDKNGNQWRAWDTKTFNQRTAAAEKL